MAMPIVAPLFIENGQLSTTVTIINAMARGTKADVVLLDQQGRDNTSDLRTGGAHAAGREGCGRLAGGALGGRFRFGEDRDGYGGGEKHGGAGAGLNLGDWPRRNGLPGGGVPNDNPI